MTPYFDRDGIQLWQGDMRDVLPTLPDKSIDLILTDPPFEAEAHVLQRRQRGSFSGAPREYPLDFEQMDDALRYAAAREMARLARRWVLVFCQIEAAPLWRVALEQHGLRYMRTCIWVKPDGQPQFTGDRPGMGYETILAMHVQGKSRWNGGGKHGVFTHMVAHHAKQSKHQTEKPLSLIKELVALFSDPGDLVLDGFAGSGTTLRACADLGRRCIGVELRPEYAAMAVSRMQQLAMPLA